MIWLLISSITCHSTSRRRIPPKVLLFQLLTVPITSLSISEVRWCSFRWVRWSLDIQKFSHLVDRLRRNKVLREWTFGKPLIASLKILDTSLLTARSRLICSTSVGVKQKAIRTWGHSLTYLDTQVETFTTTPNSVLELMVSNSPTSSIITFLESSPGRLCSEFVFRMGITRRQAMEISRSRIRLQIWSWIQPLTRIERIFMSLRRQQKILRRIKVDVLAGLVATSSTFSRPCFTLHPRVKEGSDATT